jgi:uncharacterized protein YecE (DUF72 family)
VPGEIRVGTSGWNYPGGRGTWNGVFYPARRPRGFDELGYYAEHFDTVEVNSTFYRVADPTMTQRWVERTPASFLFSIKLYQKFTHPDMYLSRKGVSDWNVSLGDFDEFRRGIDPLARAGRLCAVLAQFPPSFHAGPETRDYLTWLLSGLADYPLAVELRHRTWSDESSDTWARLAAHGATWAVIDEPKFRNSVNQQQVPGFEPQHLVASEPRNSGTPEPRHLPLYVRLHGRNASAWWDHAEAEDRYDYLYSPAELAPFAADARQAAGSGRRVLMYLNNHFSAKSVANAAILKHELGQPVAGEYPRDMIERYPELSGVVMTSGLPL